MTNQVKLALLILIGGVGYSANELYNFYTVEAPQLAAELKTLQGQVQTKERNLKRLLSFSQNIANVKRELRELNIQFQTALEHMPATFDLAKLLRKLNQLAQNSGVRLVNFNPDATENRPADAFYAITGVRFQVRGGFSESLVFFDQLSRMKRIINVRELRYASGAGQRNRNVAGTTALTLNAEILTYRFVE